VHASLAPTFVEGGQKVFLGKVFNSSFKVAFRTVYLECGVNGSNDLHEIYREKLKLRFALEKLVLTELQLLIVQIT
jgi:hypothetical protein